MVATVCIAVMSRPVGAAGGKDGENSAATVKGIFHRDVRDEARMRFVLFDCK